MELDLTEVHSFTVLAREGHFGHAAQTLHVSVSGLTKRIQRLERRLGTTLVERGPGGVVAITPAGRGFAQRGQGLLDHAHRTVAAVRAAPAAVVVAVPGGDGERILNRWVLRQPLRVQLLFQQLVCTVGLSFAQIDTALVSRRADVLLTAGPTKQPELVSTRLWPMTRVGVVAASHPLAASTSARVEDLTDWPMLHDASAPSEWMDLWCLGDVRPIDNARLVEIAPRAMGDVFGRVALGREVTVTQRAVALGLRADLSYVELNGAPPTWYFTHTRRSERRESVHQVVRALLQSGQQTSL